MVKRRRKRLQGESQVSSVVFTIISPDGNACEVESFAIDILTSEGGLWMAVLRNLSDHRHGFDALRQSEERLRSFIENISDLVTVLDHNGDILFQSPTSEKILGYASDEMAGTNAFHYIHPSDVPDVLHTFNKAINRVEGIPPIVFRCRHKNGSWRYLRVTGNSLPHVSGTTGLIINSLDITDQKLADEHTDIINRCRIGWGTNYQQNVDSITAVAAETLKATCAVYNRLEGDVLRSVSVWCEPPGYKRVDKAEGHICCDVMHLNQDNCIVVHDLLDSPYADTDPNVRAYGLQAYVGNVVRAGGRAVGSLCVVFQDNRKLSRSELHFLTDLANALSNEEERYNAEEALRQSEERYRILAENAVDLICQTDLDGVFNYISPSVKWLGYKQDDLLGRRFTEFLPEDERNSASEGFIEDLKDLRHKQYELRVLRKDGSIAWMDLSINYVVEDGAPVKVNGIGRDITERKLAEEALRESEIKFKSYIDQSIDGIFIADVSGRFIDVNPAVCTSLGYTREELLKIPHIDLIASGEDGIEAATKQYYNVIEKGRSKGEVKLVRKDGSFVFVEIHAASLGPDRYMGVVRDITERKHAEQTVLKSLKAIEKAYALQSEFVRNMTHEVRTPLTGVIGYAQALLEGVTGNVSEEQRKVLKRIVEQAESLLKIVEEVLESATLAAGVQKLDLRTLRVENVLHDVVNIFEKTAREKGISLSYRCSSRLPVVVSDAQKLTRIISNLLSNSVKFTFSGGVMITASKAGSGIDIVVEDSGTGIPKDRQEQIFDAFVQLSYPGKHKPVGAGLGLSIVSELVDVLGCSLTLSSLSGTGTAFTLHVPLQHVEMK
jgi:PAS domain S-box-containing protein